MNWLHTQLAKLIDLRRVDPDVLAEIKIELSRHFNARTKRWSERVRVSDEVTQCP